MTPSPQTMWFFNWCGFVIAHRLNRSSRLVWAPLGVNLTDAFHPVPA